MRRSTGSARTVPSCSSPGSVCTTGLPGKPVVQTEPGDEQDGTVRADPVERRMRDRELPRVADDQVQARGQDDVEADEDAEMEHVFTGEKPRICGAGGNERQRLDASGGAAPHISSRSGRCPKSPHGRTSRTAISIAKPNPSRKAEDMKAPPKLSTTPSRRPATIAPPTLPSPPRITTTKALSAGSPP